MSDKDDNSGEEVEVKPPYEWYETLWHKTKSLFWKSYGWLIGGIITVLIVTMGFKYRDKLDSWVPSKEQQQEESPLVQEPMDATTVSDETQTNDVVEEVVVEAVQDLPSSGVSEFNDVEKDPPQPDTSPPDSPCGSMLPVYDDEGKTVACKLPPTSRE